MKKLLLISCSILATLGSLTAQVPNLFNYQGVARNSTGAPVANQAISLRLSIQDDANTVLYAETHDVTSNAYGLYAVVVGSGTVISGNLNTLNWMDGEHYMKVEMDPAGGTNYVDVGAPTRLVSVPYAVNANAVQATSSGGRGLIGNAASSLWWGMYENNNYRGYIGSYAGKNEDVDFGTGGGNTVGSVHLTIGAIPKLTVDSIGRVGIGDRFPKYRLQVNGTTGSFSDNGIRIHNSTANTGWSFYASSNGDMIIGRTTNLGTFNGTTGAYTSISDARLKTNIRNMEPVLNRLNTLEAKRYEYKYNNPDHVQSLGFLAQDVQQLFPELVTENKTDEGNAAVEHQLGLDYAGLSVLAIKAIQEQQAQIEALQKEIELLKEQLRH